MFSIVERRRWYYLLSLAVIVPGLIAMVYSTLTFGTPVRLSIDFTGGSLFGLKFTAPGDRRWYSECVYQFWRRQRGRSARRQARGQ